MPIRQKKAQAWWREILRNYYGRGDAIAASNVQQGVVADSGHWVMEENPNATITMVKAFLMAG